MLMGVKKSVTQQRDSNNLLQYAEENRKEGSFNDVTINVENQRIRANRMVLASCSLYFEKLFKTEMKEKYQPTVELHDINGAAVKILIEFIYTGSIDINNENVLDLLSTADYLQVDEAKQFCFEFLQTIVTPDTCFTILTVAQLHQHKELRENALQCMKDNLKDIHFDSDLTKNDLITCISKMKGSGSNQAKESTIYQAIISWVKSDEETRKDNFLELLFLVDFTKLAVDFIEEVILREELVTKNLACLGLATKMFSDASKTDRIKRSGATTVVSFGGDKTPSRVTEIHSFIDEPPKEYPVMPKA